LRRSVRDLSSTTDEEGKFDFKKDFFNFMMDPNIREERMREYNERSLLIGGGSEPRSSVFLDRVQLLNNALTEEILYPGLIANGLIDSVTKFADITMTNCFFKDNRFPYARAHVSLIHCTS
jgi:hypothetical protein